MGNTNKKAMLKIHVDFENQLIEMLGTVSTELLIKSGVAYEVQ